MRYLTRLDTYNVYIYIIYTPNLGLEITVSVREREQGRFRGSSEGAVGSNEGEGGSSEGALREQRGSKKEHYGAVQGRSRWEPELAAWYPAIAAHVGFCQGCCLTIPPIA